VLWERGDGSVQSLLVYALKSLNLTRPNMFFARVLKVRWMIGLFCVLSCQSQTQHANLEGEWFGCAAVVVRSERVLCEVGVELRFRPKEVAHASAYRAQFADGTAVAVAVEGEVLRIGPIPPAQAASSDMRSLLLSNASSDTQIELISKLPPTDATRWEERVRNLRTAGKLEEAHTLCAASPGPTSAGLGLCARVRLASNEVPEAIQGFRSAIDLARSEQKVSQRADDTFALVYTLVERSEQHALAIEMLTSLEPELRYYPEGRARFPYYKALLAIELGELSAATELLQNALVLAQRYALRALARNTRSMQAQLQIRTGRIDEALFVMRSLRDEAETPCQRAESLVNLGYAELLHHEIASSIQTLLAVEDVACAEPHPKALASLNLAEAYVLRAQSSEARTVLAGMGEVTLKLEERLTIARIRGMVEHLEGRDPLAIATLENVTETARAARLFDCALRSGLALGQVYCQRKDKHCVQQMRRVEAMLDDAALSFPADIGKVPFLELYEGSARALVEYLPAQEALQIARHARARGLRTVATLARTLRTPMAEAVRARYQTMRFELERAAEERWTLPKESLLQARNEHTTKNRAIEAQMETLLGALPPEQLPALLPEEATLTSAPALRGERVFLAEGSSLNDWSVESSSRAPLSATAVLPRTLKDRLRATRSLRILPSPWTDAHGIEREATLAQRVIGARSKP
jgi:hypothetical protein